MKFVIQRVSKASVTVDNQMIGSIGKGFLALIGVCDSDTKETADKMIRKMLGLRIFEDSAGKTNLSLDISIPIYIVCRLPQRKPAVFYKCGRTAAGK